MRKNVARCIWLAALLVLAASLGSAIAPAASGAETRWALIVNQTNDTVIITYTEVVNGMVAKSQGPVYAGGSKRLDTSSLQGEVCAWAGKEFEPSKKIGCRTLNPGDTWIIH